MVIITYNYYIILFETIKSQLKQVELRKPGTLPTNDCQVSGYGYVIPPPDKKLFHTMHHDPATCGEKGSLIPRKDP